MGWGMRSVAEYAVANHRTLAAMLEAVRVRKTPGGLAIVTDPDAVAAAIDWLKGSPYRERDRKADIGTAVHAAIEAHILGAPAPAPSEDTAGHLAQFARFIETFNPTFELAEATVYNRTAKYAGTLDLIATIPGRGRALIDTKTSASGVYPEAALQLSAYRYAEFIGLPDGTEAPMPAVDGCAVLWIPGGDDPDGYALIPVVADEVVFRAFRHIVEVARWQEETAKGVVGQPLPVPGAEPIAPTEAVTAELFAPAEPPRGSSRMNALARRPARRSPMAPRWASSAGSPSSAGSGWARRAPRGEPKRLTKFRLTSASRALLEHASRIYGGTVRSWQGAPDEGMWELYTESDTLDILVPPTRSAYSQFYEVWDAGGCTLRCDGRWESIAEKPCDHGDHRDDPAMKLTTRVSVILPKLPGLGVWRMESHGWNAAATLPETLDLIGIVGRWIPATIRLEQRSSKERDEKTKRVTTHRFVVPVIDLAGVSFGDMLAMGATSDAYENPAPALGAGPGSLALPPGPARPPSSRASRGRRWPRSRRSRTRRRPWRRRSIGRSPRRRPRTPSSRRRRSPLRPTSTSRRASRPPRPRRTSRASPARSSASSSPWSSGAWRPPRRSAASARSSRARSSTTGRSSRRPRPPGSCSSRAASIERPCRRAGRSSRRPSPPDAVPRGSPAAPLDGHRGPRRRAPARVRPWGRRLGDRARRQRARGLARSLRRLRAPDGRRAGEPSDEDAAWIAAAAPGELMELYGK
jgi:hypothetical protein